MKNSDYMEAISLLEEFLEPNDTDCRLDHHGNCQEHGTFDSVCLIKRTRNFLKQIGEKNE